MMPDRSLVEGSNKGELWALSLTLCLCAALMCATTASVITRGSGARSGPLLEGRPAAAAGASQEPAAASHSLQVSVQACMPVVGRPWGGLGWWYLQRHRRSSRPRLASQQARKRQCPIPSAPCHSVQAAATVYWALNTTSSAAAAVPLLRSESLNQPEAVLAAACDRADASAHA